MKSIIFTPKLLIFLFSLLLVACNGQDEPSPEQVAEQTAAEQKQVSNPEMGKQIAQQHCVECHPADGNLNKAELPQINGLTESYLYKSLLDYLSGARKHEGMNKAIEKLDSQQVIDIAAYYSSLTTPWKTITISKSNQASRPSAKQIEAGKALSGPCISCHGENGNSVIEGIPSLAGLSEEYFSTALNGYFKGERHNEFMKVFKHAFGPDRIAKLAAYFSSQKRLPNTLPVAGNAKTGLTIANQRCIGCHGESGNSFIGEFPSLAGQNFKFLNQATLSYQNGNRKNSVMSKAVEGLSKTDIKNLSAYYATQKPTPPAPVADTNPGDPMQAAASAAKPCFGCHGNDGNSSLAGNPNLSGFSPGYLSDAIVQYQTGDRNHQLMKNFVVNLDSAEIELISIHFASQNPKATANSGKGKPDNVKDLTGGCEGCHGAKGVGSSKTPGLAGQDAAYLVSALISYQQKDRSNTDMQNAVASLSKGNFTDLATYYASQTPVKPEVNPLQTAAQLAKKCDRCHSTSEPNPNVPVPRIASQSEAYLLKTINDYKTKARDQSTMFAMLDALTQWEVAQIASYYANLDPAAHLNSSEK